MSKVAYILIVLALAVFAAGCTPSNVGVFEPEVKPSDGDVDGDTDASDGDAVADGDAADGDVTPEETAFIPDVAVPGPNQIVLTNPSLEGEYLFLDVVAGPIENLAGVAFRIEHGALSFTLGELEKGRALMDDAIMRGTQPERGQIWVGVSNRSGLTSTIDAPTKLLQIALKRGQAFSTRIDFSQNRNHSLAVDGKMQRLEVSFHGGFWGLPSEQAAAR